MLRKLNDVYVPKFRNGKFIYSSPSKRDRVMDYIWYAIYGIPTLGVIFGYIVGVPLKGFSIIFGG